MKKWSDITNELNQPPDPKLVRAAMPDKGIYGSYLPAQVVVMYLNEIFGPDGWSGTLSKVERDELKDGTVVFRSEYEIRGSGLNEKDEVESVYRSNGGVGIAAAWVDKQTGEVKPPKPQALDTACKGAISDGLKRTAKDFGRKLGMQLYLNEVEIALFSLYDGLEHSANGEAIKEPEEALKALTDDELDGPLVNPKKDWKDHPELTQYKNEYGKVPARALVHVFGQDAIGYLSWLWPKMEASEKDYDKKAGKELKEWLDTLEKSPVPVPAKVVDVEKSAKSTVVALLKGAKDDAKLTNPIVISLKKFLAEAGYDNDFHVQNLLKQVSGDEAITIFRLTVKQSKVLVRFANHLIENGPDSKEYAKEVLSAAFVNDETWDEAAALVEQTETKSVDVEALIKDFDPKLSLIDVAPILSGFGWPLPLPDKQLADYLKACKTAGCKLFDATATSVAKAVALQWVKT